MNLNTVLNSYPWGKYFMYHTIIKFINNSVTVQRLKLAGCLIMAPVVAVLALWLLGPAEYNVNGLQVGVSLIPAREGSTTVELPPFGSIAANTHRGPVNVELCLNQIETDQMMTYLDKTPDQEEIISDFKSSINSKVLSFGLRQLLIGWLASFLVVLFIFRPRWIVALAASLLASLLLLVVLSRVYSTYDIDAFRQPQYHGTLSMAPAALKIATESLAEVDNLKAHTDQIVTSIEGLFQQADILPVLSNPEENGGNIRILLVSDLHSNPIGVQFASNIAAQFKVDLVINAGDLTDFGTMPETNLAGELSQLAVPHLFIAGNHDTEEVSSFVRELPGSTVLDGQLVEYKGLKILGLPDPLGSTTEVEPVDEQQAEKLRQETEKQVKALVEHYGQPDILVLHDNITARRLIYNSRLTVTGHSHQMEIHKESGHVLVNPGTTGASGLRGLYSEHSIPYSAAIVHFAPGNGPLAVDMLTYDPFSQQFSLQRRLLSHEKTTSPFASREELSEWTTD